MRHNRIEIPRYKVLKVGVQLVFYESHIWILCLSV